MTVYCMKTWLLLWTFSIVLDILYKRRFGNCISVIRYKYSYPVDHLLIPALSEGSKLVSTFMRDDGNRDSIALHLEEAKMVTYVHKVNFINCKFDVCLSMHRCICVEKKNQLDATEWFIALIICSTCFGHFYAHHQELETICVCVTTACGMRCLVAACRQHDTEQDSDYQQLHNDRTIYYWHIWQKLTT